MHHGQTLQTSLVLSLLMGHSTGVFANSIQSLYGPDDRKELYAASMLHREAAQSVASLISRSQLQISANERFHITSSTFGESYNLCAEVRFAEQINPSFCSGFLAGPNLIITSAACIRDANDCTDAAFVFDFALTSQDSDPADVSSNNVYYCQGIAVRHEDANDGSDYALILLDRVVENRTPLVIANGLPANGTNVYSPHHSSGLPLKIADNALVLNSESGFFRTNLDSFMGGFGAPVIDARTQLVVGVLARGETDYITRNGCTVPTQCDSNQCQGQEATLSTTFYQEAQFYSRPRLVRTHSFSNLNALIPDANANGISIDLPVDQSGNLDTVKVHLDITHTYIGDLLVTLIHGDGTTHVLHNRTGGGDDNIVGEFVIDQVFRLKPASGTWKLLVQDLAGADVGTVNGISLELMSIIEGA